MRDLSLLTVTAGWSAENWQERANCRASDPETMQPECATREQVETAKAVCVGCPVRANCRELAKSQLMPYGVHDGEWWGPPPRVLAETCEWCGDKTGDSQRITRRFCSDRCRKAARRAEQFTARILA